MSDNDSKSVLVAALPAGTTASTSTPVAELAQALASDGEGPAKKKARHNFSEIVGARIWEQLPTQLKTAARLDARRLVGNERGLSDKLIGAGYSRRAADQLLSDIGRS
ncbi:hypothetical protein D5400_14090 [Georhizobium profundi]|uniref:Uncharacterized protein n=1 Tax=Georhizobium profundi TaxID=2341112 RepID=A0A3S9B5Q1_9HYPH|nr:hypothetical protein [Georhizobium profundi]AZN72256.1 hypothetical protein D5400_14090 [Georhizobium profundi]